MDLRSVALLVGLAATWGASYVLTEISLRELSPAAISFGRLALGALLVVALAARQGVLGALRGRMLGVTLVGLAQFAVPLLLLAQGQRSISSALAGTLVATTPVWAALLAPLIGVRRLAALEWGGIFVGLLGVALLLGLDAGAADGGLLGALLVLLTALGYAVGSAAATRSFTGLPPLAALAGSMSTSALVLLPFALLDAPSTVPSGQVLVCMGAIGLAGTGIGFVVFYRLLSTIGPARTLLVTYLAPVFAVTYGVVLLSEDVAASTVGGLLLVLLGAWLAAGRPGRPQRSDDVSPSRAVPTTGLDSTRSGTTVSTARPATALSTRATG